jgi:2-dehydro-3-deoxygalactonokinase
MSLFISCDWGTSNLRLRLIDQSTAQCLAEARSDQGIAATYRSWTAASIPAPFSRPSTAGQGIDATYRLSFYQRTLLPLIYELKVKLPPGLLLPPGLPLILSGMASSRLGLLELPYTKLPSAITPHDLIHTLIPASGDFPFPTLLISGACTDDDVLRGEETQLLGAFSSSNLTPHAATPAPAAATPAAVAASAAPATPAAATSAAAASGSAGHLYIFPGTHSKHILTRAGLAISFQTFMTGEFFHLLSTQSILSASLESPDSEPSSELGSFPELSPQPESVSSPEPKPSSPSGPLSVSSPTPAPISNPSFAEGVLASRGSGLLHNAFLTRTRQLLQNRNKQDNYYFLSGLLIGEELKYLSSSPTPLTIVGTGALRSSYITACGLLDIKDFSTLDGDQALIKGHCNFYHFLF